MLLAWVMTAIAGVTTVTDQPARAPEMPEQNLPVYRVPGPAFEIPCKVNDRTPDLVAVQLWVSADGGKTWEKYAEIKPDETNFEYHAQKPGEYLFAPRLKFKDGRVTPAVGRLTPTQRVAVEAGYEPVTPARATLMAKIADDLDEELTRIELELIRKEIGQLAATKGLSQETANKIDRLRSRLREAQERLQHRNRATIDQPLLPPAVEVPPVRTYRNETLIPPPVRPVPVSPPAPREVP
jgi:hypothetical protein